MTHLFLIFLVFLLFVLLLFFLDSTRKKHLQDTKMDSSFGWFQPQHRMASARSCSPTPVGSSSTHGALSGVCPRLPSLPASRPAKLWDYVFHCIHRIKGIFHHIEAVSHKNGVLGPGRILMLLRYCYDMTVSS